MGSGTGLLQRTATLPGGTGQCNSCDTLPHLLGVLGRGTAAIDCLTAWGQWVAGLLQCTASLSGGSGQWAAGLLQCTASLCGGSGHCISCKHCFTAQGQWAVELLLNTASLPAGSGHWSSRSCCNALLLCLGALSSATGAMRCLTARGQWAVGLLQYTASPPGGNGQSNSCHARPHCLEAMGNATPAMH